MKKGWSRLNVIAPYFGRHAENGSHYASQGYAKSRTGWSSSKRQPLKQTYYPPKRARASRRTALRYGTLRQMGNTNVHRGPDPECADRTLGDHRCHKRPRIRNLYRNPACTGPRSRHSRYPRQSVHTQKPACRRGPQQAWLLVHVPALT